MILANLPSGSWGSGIHSVEYHFMVLVVELSSGFTEGLRIYLQTEGLTSCIYGFEGVHIIC